MWMMLAVEESRITVEMHETRSPDMAVFVAALLDREPVIEWDGGGNRLTVRAFGPVSPDVFVACAVHAIEVAGGELELRSGALTLRPAAKPGRDEQVTWLISTTGRKDVPGRVQQVVGIDAPTSWAGDFMIVSGSKRHNDMLEAIAAVQ